MDSYLFDESDRIGLRLVAVNAASQAVCAGDDFFLYLDNLAEDPTLIAETPEDALRTFLRATAIWEPQHADSAS